MCIPLSGPTACGQTNYEVNLLELATPTACPVAAGDDAGTMFFALSDLILSTTLMINAGAVLSFKIPSNGGAGLDGVMTFKERLFVLISSLRVFRYASLPRPAAAAPLASPSPSPNLRRIVIGLWNLFVLLLMVVWFP